MLRSCHKWFVVGVPAALLAASGCVPPPDFDILEFLAALGFTGGAATLPGEAPAVIIELENRTGRVIEGQLTWRNSDGTVDERILVVPSDSKTSEAVICPVEEMTLGDVSNPQATGAVVRLGDGGPTDPFIAVEAFGVILKQDINYSCGDSVTFTVQPSNLTNSGYQAFAFIRRADSSAVLP